MQRKNIQTFLFSWQHDANNSDWILNESTIPIADTCISCSHDYSRVYTCPIGRFLFLFNIISFHQFLLSVEQNSHGRRLFPAAQMSTGVTGSHNVRWRGVATGRTWGGRWEDVGSSVHQQIEHSRKVVFEELTIANRSNDTVIETQPLSYCIVLDFGDVMASLPSW